MTAVTLPAALRRSAGWKALSAHARLVFIELLAGAVPDARLISRKTGVGEATVRRAFGDLSEA
jgi:hypothetical protein